MMAMTFDAARGKTVMFGGGSPSMPLTALTDTWTYDGTTWTQVLSGGGPPAVGRTSMVYDNARRVAVLFGGIPASPISGGNSDETWEWNGTSWSQVFTLNNPSRRHSFAMAYDSVRQRTVLYGGISGGLAATSDTWEFDGFDWTRKIATSGPGPRAGASMCYHAGLGKVVMYGGIDPFTGGLPGTWAYNGTSWTKLNLPGPVPPLREDGRMVYDASRGVAVMVGGFDGTSGAAIRQDTWEFDGTRWRQVADTIATPRVGVGLAMDAVRQRVVMFGGMTNNLGSQGTNETSELGGYFRKIGVGCPGNLGVPVLSSTTIPHLGGTLTFDLAKLQPVTGQGFLVLGGSDVTWAGLPLPLDATAFGITGCFVNVSWDVTLPVAVNPFGTASVTFTVPTTPSFFGLELMAQGVSIDIGVNRLGLVLSNGAGAMLGL